MTGNRFDFLELDTGTQRQATTPRVGPAAQVRRRRQVELRVIEIIGAFGVRPGEFNSPSGLALDRQGNLYVADALNHRVQRITPTGEVTVLGEPGRRMGQLMCPKAVALDYAGYLYVVEQGNCRVQKFDWHGEWVSGFGAQGSSPGQLNNPSGVGVDDFHNLYIADAGNRRVQVFTAEGRHLYTIPRSRKGAGQVELGRPSGVAVQAREGLVYIADTGASQVYRCDREGSLLGSYGRPGPGPGELCEPWAVALDREGNVWVTEVGNNRLQCFRPDGSLEAAFTTQRGLPGRIMGPAGVVVDERQGEVYLADTLNHRVLRIAVGA